ncbi:hypothetical protein ACYG9R_28430 [Mesorhizobium sp. RSR565B]|uniref:hypothetical protein n=1 Tax=Mesorhizobium sp. L103C565B0 TaxID=1287094 RepID=UPI0003CFC4F0|nr:hypothetical protein [Mesorhizobium sp. L103C565B0]ESZ41088.1 hypothetical protein X730_29830 [Mesorhizobium sp. L103C565B0]
MQSSVEIDLAGFGTDVTESCCVTRKPDLITVPYAFYRKAELGAVSTVTQARIADQNSTARPS